MKKILSLFLCFLTIFFCAGCGEKETKKENPPQVSVSDYFDLSDEKILFDEKIFSIVDQSASVCQDRLVIYLKRVKIYKELTIKDFQIKNITSVDYSQFEPEEERKEDTQYIENFRQELYVGFIGVVDREGLIAKIREFEKLDFVKEVQVVLAVDDFVIEVA